jgi:hypothetical protein
LRPWEALQFADSLTDHHWAKGKLHGPAERIDCRSRDQYMKLVPDHVGDCLVEEPPIGQRYLADGLFD